MNTIVSLVKSQNHHSGVNKALALIEPELKKALSKTNQVVVKINFVSAFKELATTPLETVKGFIDFIQKFYQGEIVIAEEAAIGRSIDGFKRFGFEQLAKENRQVKLLDSARSTTEKVTINYPGGTIILPLAKVYTPPSFVVSICRAKTHDAVVVTLGIKNLLVGAVQQKLLGNRQKIHQGKKINWILAEIAHHAFPKLTIIDGITGMEGNGPAGGKPINSQWLIASLDALAADSLASYLMGFKIEDIGYLNLIKKKGLGAIYPKDKIKILGEEPEELVMPYQPHYTFSFQRQWQA